MDNMNVAPVNHGVLSATGSVAAGATGGFFKTGIKSGAGWFAAMTVLGALIGAATLLPGGGIAAVILWGAGGGALFGLVSSPLAAAIGSAIGAFTGGNRAINQVKAEKGAANVLEAQVDAYKSQAQAEAYAAAASNDNGKYNSLPVQGSAYNQAGSAVNSFQRDGVVNGQELQRA